MVFLEELQSSCQMGCSQLKVQQGKVLLTSSFSGCRQASKHPLPTELTRAVPQVCLIICQLTSPKPSNPKEHEHAKTVREPQHRSHCLFITQCHSAQLKLKGKRLHKYRASLGNYYILSNFYSLETLWMRPLRLGGVITCLSGKARIQIQVCMTPNLFNKPQYYIAFSDKTSVMAGGLGTRSVLL